MLHASRMACSKRKVESRRGASGLGSRTITLSLVYTTSHCNPKVQQWLCKFAQDTD